MNFKSEKGNGCVKEPGALWCPPKRYNPVSEFLRGPAPLPSDCYNVRDFKRCRYRYGPLYRPKCKLRKSRYLKPLPSSLIKRWELAQLFLGNTSSSAAPTHSLSEFLNGDGGSALEGPILYLSHPVSPSFRSNRIEAVHKLSWSLFFYLCSSSSEYSDSSFPSPNLYIGFYPDLFSLGRNPDVRFFSISAVLSFSGR